MARRAAMARYGGTVASLLPPHPALLWRVVFNGEMACMAIGSACAATSCGGETRRIHQRAILSLSIGDDTWRQNGRCMALGK